MPILRSPISAVTYLTNLQFDLTKFWEIEEGPTKPHFSSEEIACEKHFQKHATRNTDGRYVVALPFREEHINLGESRARALTRLNALNRKFINNSALREQYAAVIDEYKSLRHMAVSDPVQENGFYLPHHAVVKESSTTTKLRVVFDGSAKSSTGIFLNETLMVGPTIQQDIFTLTTRFRTHNFVLTGDIDKMYRQFLVQESDRMFQRILWTDSNGVVKTYGLNTLIFGLASAPFLAIHWIHQLTDDEKHRYPTAAKILQRDLYLDDLLTGADTIEDALEIRNEVIEMLRLEKLNLRQWASPIHACFKVSRKPAYI
ncbi:uncharacterized protein LOC105697081 [Orussus abietinus]|uniref:uncharacterized protein LOC105697081 n=1 Tax=Orussus abietinus TaxID=222816 RepID=UPI0006264ED8|nr:uncharacterized protein LOC105697081 [Orussus abietinus]